MYNLDLRFAVPGLLNLVLSLLQNLQEKPWFPSVPNFNMNWKSWFFSIAILTLFLITSVKLPLSFIVEHIQVRYADFSFFLAIALLGSVSLPQPLFWFGYTVIICLSPWHGFLSQLMLRFLLSIWGVLRGIPVLLITCIFQLQNHQQDETETDASAFLPQVVVAVDTEGNPILLEQPTSEPNTVVAGQP